MQCQYIDIMGFLWFKQYWIIVDYSFPKAISEIDLEYSKLFKYVIDYFLIWMYVYSFWNGKTLSFIFVTS